MKKKELYFFGVLTLKWMWIIFMAPCMNALSSPFAFFSPPKGWQISDPSLFQNEVKIGFVQSKKAFFSPAVSLVIEKINKASLATYLKAVRKNYKDQHKHRYRELGVLNTNSGKVHLALIDQTSEYGPLKILQAISIHNGYAIIQTATALKKDFSQVRPEILNCFRSLTLSSDLWSSFTNSSQKKLLKEKVKKLQVEWERYKKDGKKTKRELFFNPLFQQNVWSVFVDDFIATFNSQGSCWQFLALKTIQTTLLNT